MSYMLVKQEQTSKKTMVLSWYMPDNMVCSNFKHSLQGSASGPWKSLEPIKAWGPLHKDVLGVPKIFEK